MLTVFEIIAILTAMSSIVRVTKNNQVYLYESRSYWDKEKKSPRVSRDYGNIFVLEKIGTQLGLSEILRDAFPAEWEKLLSCVFFEVSEGKPLYLCGTWLESTYTNLVDRLASQRISELIKSVGENLHARLEFARMWTEKRKRQFRPTYRD